jgi:hypothetical protein
MLLALLNLTTLSYLLCPTESLKFGKAKKIYLVFFLHPRHFNWGLALIVIHVSHNRSFFADTFILKCLFFYSACPYTISNCDKQKSFSLYRIHLCPERRYKTAEFWLRMCCKVCGRLIIQNSEVFLPGGA